MAVLAVFANHLFDWPPGGFVGVDVFFVLSGFLITGLLIGERNTTRRVSYQQFYIRRLKRVLPSAVLVLVTTVVGAHLLLPATRAKSTLVDALYAAVCSANFRFDAVGAEPFHQGSSPLPIQHFWSLSIGEQFYVAWPWLLAGVFLLTRSHRQQRRGWLRQWGLVAAMTLIVVASFSWAFYLADADPNAAYFSTFTRVWELGVGALLAIAAPWLTRIPAAARPWLAYLGLAGIVVSLFVISPATRWPAPWAALPTLSTVLVIASFHEATLRGMVVLNNPVMRWFGDTSYTLYLWHWPVIVLLLAVLPKGPLFYSLAMVIALVLTAVTYHYWEDPIRESHWLLETRRDGMPSRIHRGIWAALGVLMASLAVVSILRIHQDEYMTTVEHEVAQAQEPDRTATTGPQSEHCFGAAALITPGCALRNPDIPLQPSVDAFATDARSESQGCYRVKEFPLRACNYGYNGIDATHIVLVGDSHAEQILPALLPSLLPNKWQLTTYVGIDCQWKSPPSEKCLDAKLMNSALLNHPFDVVLTTASRQAEGTAAEYAAAWQPVAAAGSHIVVLADSPGVNQDSLNCLTRVSPDGDRAADCGVSRAEAFAQPDQLVEAAKLVPGTSVIDLTAHYCTADRCPSVIGNVIVYRDVAGQLTNTYAITLAPALAEQLRSVLE
ncbi:acyltransferase family protein [Mycolicibacterium aichiense]|uniref:acyltransferase family protein n=1 Tax=Mycolicibacterium aichiense TaxID=1799 RepID=UPI003D668911